MCLGALLLSLIYNAVVLWQISSYHYSLVTGLLLLTAVLADLAWRRLEPMTRSLVRRAWPYLLPGGLLLLAVWLVSSQASRPSAVLDMWRPWGEIGRSRPR